MKRNRMIFVKFFLPKTYNLMLLKQGGEAHLNLTKCDSVSFIKRSEGYTLMDLTFGDKKIPLIEDALNVEIPVCPTNKVNINIGDVYVYPRIMKDGIEFFLLEAV